MVEILKDNYHFKHNQVALKVNRYRKQGYITIGVGYPFFFYEYLGLIKLCDFFVDDKSASDVTGWSKRFKIKDCKNIERNQRYVVLLFASNRISTLEKIKQITSSLEIINLCEDSEIISSFSDIENSKMLFYKAVKNKPADILESISIKGKCEIIDTAKTTLKISFLEMQKNSKFISNSRFENTFDSLYLRQNTTLRIDLDGQAYFRNCLLNDNSKINIYSGELKIEDTYIGENCTIHVYNRIVIGTGTIISWNVSILDGDGHSIFYEDKYNRPQPISIEDNVWIGNNVIILKGVTIGAGSVIAAGSVVTKSIPPYSLATGNPAKVIKSDIKWEYKYGFKDFD
jgi:acetyltransferase-like isoleucine patch superfamily enzyme